ncbi:DUF2798 domain-containing protein [Aliiruegeria lutimaris]|uniref:DUF2798 domain-containing protein n=1 Tax=Aliiruegeria lutimaris TaxID=571298 RepID=A0A1G9A9I7_9RHOB|nr:DUF2798 domain-containing protein [Aliiruegeria lutimaris]SDK23494.1 Protein of unknown function [Aliiruegeria lutimaris]
MKDTTTLFTAQIFISFLMALIMTGIFSAVPTGFAPGWIQTWLAHFAVAWPVAFLLSLLVGPESFFLAEKVVGRLKYPSV